jgi:prepilin-type N-terminal cleavage/methylation domain-containing protein
MGCLSRLSRRGPGIQMKRPLADRRRGFTLLELLTVMAIMLLLMGMALGAYHGFLRGAAIGSAVANVRGVLTSARQFAVTHRCRTYVVFWQDGTNSNYVVCKEEGRQEGNLPDVLVVDPPRWAPDELIGQNIFNLTSGKNGTVRANTANQLWATPRGGPVGACLQWNRYDRYGWALQSQKHLPQGIGFGDGTSADTPGAVRFNPDGTTPLPPASTYYSIMLRERFASASPAQREIRVQGLTGQVVVP